MSDREEDLTLIKFLRQHQSVAPPPSPNLETQIMEAVASCPRSNPQRRYLWIFPSAIAISYAFTWVGSQLIAPLTAPLETAAVEEFWTENWDALSQEPTPQNTTSDTLIANELIFAPLNPDEDAFSAELTSNRR